MNDAETAQAGPNRRAFHRSPCCMKLRLYHPLSGRSYQAHGIDVSPDGMLLLVPGFAHVDVSEPVELHVPQSSPPLRVGEEGLTLCGRIVRIERASLASTGTIALAVHFDDVLPAKVYTEKSTGKSRWRTTADILLPSSRFTTP
jgi:hypothetical protein